MRTNCPIFVFLLSSTANLRFLYSVNVIFVDKFWFLPYTKDKPMQILEKVSLLRSRGIKPVLYA